MGPALGAGHLPCAAMRSLADSNGHQRCRRMPSDWAGARGFRLLAGKRQECTHAVCRVPCGSRPYTHSTVLYHTILGTYGAYVVCTPQSRAAIGPAACRTYLP